MFQVYLPVQLLKEKKWSKTMHEAIKRVQDGGTVTHVDTTWNGDFDFKLEEYLHTYVFII